jgi:hypothetical protein
MVSTLTTASPSSISRDLKAFLVVQQLSKRDDNAMIMMRAYINVVDRSEEDI